MKERCESFSVSMIRMTSRRRKPFMKIKDFHGVDFPVEFVTCKATRMSLRLGRVRYARTRSGCAGEIDRNQRPAGAEGATAPETLRPQDRVCRNALESVV